MTWLGSRLAWGIAALGLLVMAGGFGYVKGHAAGKAAGDARVAALTAQYAQAQAKAEAEARAKEQTSAAAMAAIDARHAQELKDAQAKSDAVIADLRDGTLRLRREWAGCQATAGVSGAATGAGEPDGAAELRAASAARVVRVAAEADAQIRVLQAVIQADRKTGEK